MKEKKNLLISFFVLCALQSFFFSSYLHSDELPRDFNRERDDIIKPDPNKYKHKKNNNPPPSSVDQKKKIINPQDKEKLLNNLSELKFYLFPELKNESVDVRKSNKIFLETLDLLVKTPELIELRDYESQEHGANLIKLPSDERLTFNVNNRFYFFDDYVARLLLEAQSKISNGLLPEKYEKFVDDKLKALLDKEAKVSNFFFFRNHLKFDDVYKKYIELLHTNGAIDADHEILFQSLVNDILDLQNLEKSTQGLKAKKKGNEMARLKNRINKAILIVMGSRNQINRNKENLLEIDKLQNNIRSYHLDKFADWKELSAKLQFISGENKMQRMRRKIVDFFNYCLKKKEN